MLELKHVQRLGYIFILEQTPSQNLNILSFIHSFRFAVSSGSAPTTVRVSGENRKARCGTGSSLPFLCPACCLTHFGRTRQIMGGAEVRMRRGGMIQQENRPCSVVWPLAAAERPQMQLFAWPCGSHFPLNEVSPQSNVSHSDPPGSGSLGLRLSCTFVPRQRDSSKVSTHQNKHLW